MSWEQHRFAIERARDRLKSAAEASFEARDGKVIATGAAGRNGPREFELVVA